MKRSTYSLILMDDVVSEIDMLAAQNGTSRSNYINQILADYLSFVTPEKQLQQVFSHLIDQMDSAFRIQEQGSNTMLSILGSVKYKYRPTIRYQVELLRNLQDNIVGQLKISCRSQSETLLEAMSAFFQFWIRLEQAHDCHCKSAKDLYHIDTGRMTRLLLRNDLTSFDDLGTAVGDYIQMFHTVLQTYFNGLQQSLPAVVLQHTLEQQYLAIREQTEHIL